MAHGLLKSFFWTVVRLLGGLGGGVAIVLVIAAWRLSTGPISLAFLTPYAESALASIHPSFRIKMTDTVLTWAGWERTLDIRIIDLRVLSETGEPVAKVPEMALSLSAQGLVKGLIAPQSIEMFRPKLKMVRHRDGTFEVGFNTGVSDSNRFLHRMLALLLAEPDPSNPMSYLSRVNIFDADLQVVDQQLQTSWSAPKTQVELLRDAVGIKGDVTMDVLVGDAKANVSVLGAYLADEGRFDLGVDFNQLKPAAIATLTPRLAMLAGIDVPFQGTLTLSMLTDGTLESIGFDVNGSAGTLSLPEAEARKIGLSGLERGIAVTRADVRGRYEGLSEKIEINALTLELGPDGAIDLPAPIDHRMPLKTVNARGRFLGQESRLELDAVELDLNGPNASLALNMVSGGEGVSMGASGVLRNMKIDALSSYWPKSLAADARDWIVDRISVGQVPEARAALQLRAKRGGGVDLVSLKGDMTIRNATVDYLPPMAKARNVDATARFTEKKFDIFVSRAESEGLATRKSILSFKGLDQDEAHADIDFFVKGPLQNALGFIESKPLQFSSAMGIAPEKTAGTVSAHLKLGFPMVKKLSPADVESRVSAKIHDAVIDDDVVFGLGLADGQLELKATRRSMDLRGEVKLGGLPASVEWRRNFGPGASPRNEYKLALAIDNIHSLRDLGVDMAPLPGDFIEGAVKADVHLTNRDDGTGLAKLRLDLKDAALNAPSLGWRKPAGVPGTAQADLEVAADRLVGIPRFSVAAGDLRMNGLARYAEDGTGLDKVEISRVSYNRTDLSGVVIPGDDGGWTVSFHGPSVDLEPMFADLFGDQAGDGGDAGPNLSLSANVDKVWIGPDRSLRGVTGTFSRANARWRSMHVDGSLGDGKTFQVALGPGGKGRRTLSVKADDAGTLLRTLDVYDAMVGGILDLEAAFDDTVPGHPLSGEVVISDYRLVDAPALARLVSVLTLTGIADALKGDGLSFSEMRAPFVMHDGIIEVDDAKATGLSLGYTAKGKIYSHAEIIDFEGTVVPAYAINSVLGNIPILGTLLTGTEEGGGIFAATYAMNGPMEDPEVKVNPLTALAPGIFRNLFGIFTGGGDKDVESAGGGKSDTESPLGQSEGL